MAWTLFHRQTRQVGQYDDPHIVRGLEYGQESKVPYLVMNFADGKSLTSHLNAVGPMAESDAVQMMGQVAKALETAIDEPEPNPEIADLSEPQVLERRASVRHACELESLCSPVGSNGQLSWKAAVTDISGHGIGLILQRRFERGTVLDLRWQRAIRDAIGTTTARVVRTQALESGLWLLACQLARKLDDKDLGIVLAHGVPRRLPAHSSR